MRLELSVTSMSWIPSDSAPGLYKAGFDVGASHCDDPPPDVIDDLAERKQITPPPSARRPWQRDSGRRRRASSHWSPHGVRYAPSDRR